jgi:predicted CopG family antitoxin
MLAKILKILKKKKPTHEVSSPLNQFQSNAEISKKLKDLKRHEKNRNKR